MTSVHSGSVSVEADEVDLSGLVESIVDSDEDDLGDSSESLTVRDTVRECLEKDPSERAEDDVEVLLEFTQHLKAFTNMTLAVRRALCSVMVFAVVEKAGTVVMNDGEELDSWSVLINGHVEVEHADGVPDQLHMGDSFGIVPTMERLYHRGVMRTKCDDCQFVCITQTDYYRILHQGEENTKRHEDDGGKLVMVTEQRGTLEAGRRGHVVIRVSSTQLCHICMIDNIRYYCQSSSYYRITIVILLICIVIV
jgi:Rap guanine nucleotide exchange factor 2